MPCRPTCYSDPAGVGGRPGVGPGGQVDGPAPGKRAKAIWANQANQANRARIERNKRIE